jgi:hypothetical protein
MNPGEQKDYCSILERALELSQQKVILLKRMLIGEEQKFGGAEFV